MSDEKNERLERRRNKPVHVMRDGKWQRFILKESFFRRIIRAIFGAVALGVICASANAATNQPPQRVVLSTTTAGLVTSTSTIVMKSASFSITATGTLISAVTNKTIRVYALAYISGGIASFNFRDGGSTALEGAFAHAANSGRVEGVNPPAYLFKTTSGNSLDGVFTGAGTVAGRLSYWEE